MICVVGNYSVGIQTKAAAPAVNQVPVIEVQVHRVCVSVRVFVSAIAALLPPKSQQATHMCVSCSLFSSLWLSAAAVNRAQIIALRRNSCKDSVTVTKHFSAGKTAHSKCAPHTWQCTWSLEMEIVVVNTLSSVVYI